ncbi:hypothetical protein ACSFBI_03640 [Variovorax sp. RB3P1]|uniref:hypothetical protein n=1 Tax=Variovorax sp. RB3P1 TaxID=3443732 RepID=UPI003F482EE9
MKRDSDRQRQLRPTADFKTLNRTQEKGEAQDFIARVLASFEHADQSPDEWEASDLLYACGLIAAGMYAGAVHYTDRALTPLEDRSNRGPKPEFVPSLRQLQQAHHDVAHLAVVER